MKNTQNHGSAIGEAIGSTIEKALHKSLSKICTDLNFELITTGSSKQESRSSTKKLLISDEEGVKYNLDGIVVNSRRQPIILLESKWIRYKKHNRDKGSWIANSHREIKKRYPTIRGSLALLAGEWSKPSLEMLEQAQITVIRIEFDEVANRLLKDGIDIRWEEKDRSKSEKAWLKFQKLDYDQINSIGSDLIKLVQTELETFMEVISKPRQVFNLSSLSISIEESGGWLRSRRFNSVDDAINFLKNINVKEIFSTQNGPSID